MYPYSLDDIDEDVDDDDGFYEDQEGDDLPFPQRHVERQEGDDDEDEEDDEDEDEETWQVSSTPAPRSGRRRTAKVRRLLDIGQRTA